MGVDDGDDVLAAHLSLQKARMVGNEGRLALARVDEILQELRLPVAYT